MRAFLLCVCVPLCLVYSSEGRVEGVHYILNESLATAGRSGSPPSSAVSWWEGNTKIGYGACLSLLVSQNGTGDGCLFLLDPAASDLNPIEIKTGSRPPEHETCAHDAAAACSRMPR